MSAQLLEG